METKNPTLADQHVGRRLRGRRQELNLSQQELADRLGVTFQQVQKYERGANRISAGRLFDLAKALETQIGYFYAGLDMAAAARRGVSEEATDFAGPVDAETLELLAAFQRIEDPAIRKSMVSMVKKAARTSRPGGRPARKKARDAGR